MHHKWLLADDVVWTGSYNLTFAARRNYETALRFDDADVAAVFWRMLDALCGDADLWVAEHGSQYASAGGRFRCCNCHTLCPADAEWAEQGDSSDIICQACGDRFILERDGGTPG
jgi:phosphatidylserine/phosphatidylglycerophosphate/cardiolipin synthase-like enzyme